MIPAVLQRLIQGGRGVRADDGAIFQGILPHDVQDVRAECVPDIDWPLRRRCPTQQMRRLGELVRLKKYFD
ncbi:MAG: hypothetical protein ABI895_37295 [Deltaproteobacteria bacterium]